MKSSCIKHPEKENLIIVRQWQLVFCEGNTCAATLLSLFEYWHNIKLEEASKSGEKSMLQWHTEKDLEERTLIYKRTSIKKAIEFLVNKKVIKLYRNPDKRFFYDKTRHFLFIPEVINKWLDNYYCNLSEEKQIEEFDKYLSSYKTKVKNKDCNEKGYNSTKVKNTESETDNIFDASQTSKMMESPSKTMEKGIKNNAPIPKTTNNNTSYTTFPEIQLSKDSCSMDFEKSSMQRLDQEFSNKEFFIKNKTFYPVNNQSFINSKYPISLIRENNFTSLINSKYPISFIKGDIIMSSNNNLIKEEASETIINKNNNSAPSSGSSLREKIASNRDALKPDVKIKTPTEPRMSDDVKKLVNLWEVLGLHKSKSTTKTFREGVKNLQSLLNGTAFSGNNNIARIDKRRYTVEEIEITIRRFAKAALDKNYEPVGDYKNKLKSISISSFVYNSFAPKMKSLFLNYLENEPNIIKASKEAMIDNYPSITKVFKKYYLSSVMGGIKIELTEDDNNYFIIASKKLVDFYEKNRGRMYLRDWESELPDFLCEALTESVGGEGSSRFSKIKPSWFASDITFNKTLPSYLLENSMYYGRDVLLDGSESNFFDPRLFEKKEVDKFDPMDGLDEECDRYFDDEDDF